MAELLAESSIQRGRARTCYHVTNVFLHFLVSVLVALIAMRLLEWAGRYRSRASSGQADAGHFRGRAVSGSPDADRIRGLCRQPLGGV